MIAIAGSRHSHITSIFSRKKVEETHRCYFPVEGVEVGICEKLSLRHSKSGLFVGNNKPARALTCLNESKEA